MKVPVLIDYIHVYLDKAAAALHPGDRQAAWRSAAARHARPREGRRRHPRLRRRETRFSPRTRHLNLTDVDKAVTYLANNHKHMRYDKALERDGRSPPA